MAAIDELLALNERFDSIIKWIDFNRKRKVMKANTSKLLRKAFLEAIDDEISKEYDK